MQRRRIRAKPQRGIVHFHKVFKGVRPIGPAVILLVQRPLWGGHAETQGFPIVFEGSQGQPVRMRGMLDFTIDLMGKLIEHRLICDGFPSTYSAIHNYILIN